MLQRASALLSAHHSEVRLMTIDPRHEDHARLVESRGRPENVPRQCNRRLQDVVIARGVPRCQFTQRGGRGRRDSVENAEQRVALPMVFQCADTVPRDQLGIVEIVAGVHPHALGQPTTHRDFLILVEQRDLDPVDLAGVRRDDAERSIHCVVEICGAPIACQCRVEHIAQPVQHNRLPRLAQDAVVHAFVVGWRFRHAGKRAARHDDQGPAQRLDRFHLFFVRANHVVDVARVFRRQVVRAASGCDQRARRVFGRIQRTPDQFQRGCPVQAHAALGSVHRFGNAEAERPQVSPISHRRIPIDRALRRRIMIGERIGNDVRRRISDSRGLWAQLLCRETGGFAELILLQVAVAGWELQGNAHRSLFNEFLARTEVFREP
ncbi:hypothetical protein BCAR13_1560013 [Paraburkholderia caribensis]|nr:hypothetical protein BCAR13_1560013 [Paraburkholderia caribensis]